MTSLLPDLRYGWRSLIRTPGFLLAAVFSLALGIGANTALFSLIYSAIYKALPIDEPQQLVLFDDPNVAGVAGGSGGHRGADRPLLSWPEFQDFHAMKSMNGLFAVESSLPKMHVIVGSSEEEARLKMVSGAYFSVLRLRPQIGRFFDKSVDAQIGGAPFVVLSDQYWSRRFGRDPAAIGQRIVIEKSTFAVIGVAPRGFAGENIGQNPDFWAPLSMQMQIIPTMDMLHSQPDPFFKVMWLHVFGRLKPAATMAQAQAEASFIFKASLEQSFQTASPPAKKLFMDQHLRLRAASNGASGLRDKFADSLFIIFAAVGATLLICCANLSNLLLARANARQTEITVRLALGASHFQVAQQLLAEGLLLSGIGAVFGLLLSQAITPLFLRMASSGNKVIYVDAGIDWRVLLFTGVVAIGTTLICSLIPSIRAAKTQPMSTLRPGGRGLTTSRSKRATGRLFVVAQVALSLVLLVAAGLFMRTLVNLQNVDLGYKKDGLVTVSVDARTAGYKPEALGMLFKRVLEKLRATPGVLSATFSKNGLFSGEEGSNITAEGYVSTGNDDKDSMFDEIAPGYFSTLRIAMLQGREIQETDSITSPNVCVINDAFAKKFFAGRNPIGMHVISKVGDVSTPFEIVGVAKDSRDHALREKVVARVFVSFLQGKFMGGASGSAAYEVRLATAGGAALSQLRRTVLGVDPSLRVQAELLTSSIDERLAQDRLVANLVTLFGCLALALAAIGIYGILAYGVTQRTNEIGLRMAIGARTGDVLKLIAQETVWMVSVGVATGLMAAYFLSRLLESKLFGVTAMDPLVMGSAIAILSVVGFLAATLPALRAARIDPAIALRNE
jgi:predicted permease